MSIGGVLGSRITTSLLNRFSFTASDLSQHSTATASPLLTPGAGITPLSLVTANAQAPLDAANTLVRNASQVVRTASRADVVLATQTLQDVELETSILNAAGRYHLSRGGALEARFSAGMMHSQEVRLGQNDIETTEQPIDLSNFLHEQNEDSDNDSIDFDLRQNAHYQSNEQPTQAEAAQPDPQARPNFQPQARENRENTGLRRRRRPNFFSQK